MAIQLTPEQKQRIQAIVKSGAYPSAQEALDAAVAAVEIAAAAGFEGSQNELESLLLEGLASKELSEEEFFEAFDREANAMQYWVALPPPPQINRYGVPQEPKSGTVVKVWDAKERRSVTTGILI